MAKQIKVTDRAKMMIRDLPDKHIGDAVRKIIEVDIASDPQKMTTGYAFGRSLTEKEVTLPGNIYSVSISFTTTPESNDVFIETVQAHKH